MLTGFDEQTKPTKEKKDKEPKPFSPPNLNLRPDTFNIRERVFKFIVEEEKKRNRPQTRVHASSIKECARKQAMSIMGFTPTATEMQNNNPQWRLSAQFGTEIHSLFEKYLAGAGLLVKAEYRVESDDGAVSGRVDALVEDSVWAGVVEEGKTARQAILDVKTVKHEDFKKGAWGDKIPGYIAQLSVYCRLENVPSAIICLVSRNTGEILALEFDADYEYADTLLTRASWIADSAEKRELPSAEERGSFYCTAFCPFNALCSKEEYTKDEDGLGEISRLLRNGLTVAEIELFSNGGC